MATTVPHQSVPGQSRRAPPGPQSSKSSPYIGVSLVGDDDELAQIVGSNKALSSEAAGRERGRAEVICYSRRWHVV